MVKIGFNSDKRLLSFASVCAALLLPLCAAESYSDWFTGDGTYYGPISNGNGNCAMRGSLPGGVYDGMIAVAINGEQYESSKMCGACIEGTASGKGSGNHPLPRSFKAYVIDQCPGCGKGDLDFSRGGDGRWDIKWRFVTCPIGKNNDQPEFLFEGSNDYYWKLQPRGTKTPVDKLWVNDRQATRTQDNFFVISPPSGKKYSGTQEVTTKTIRSTVKTKKVSRS